MIRHQRLTVVCGVIVTEDDIDILAVLVLDKEVCESCTIFDKLSILSVCLTFCGVKFTSKYLRLDPRCLEGKFPVWARREVLVGDLGRFRQGGSKQECGESHSR